MRTTGGLAVGATSTRSNPSSWARASATSTSRMPSCEPSGAITRTGLMRICRLTRTRLVLSWIVGAPPRKKRKTRTLRESAMKTRASCDEAVVAHSELLQHARLRGAEGW